MLAGAWAVDTGHINKNIRAKNIQNLTTVSVNCKCLNPREYNCLNPCDIKNGTVRFNPSVFLYLLGVLTVYWPSLNIYQSPEVKGTDKTDKENLYQPGHYDSLGPFDKTFFWLTLNLFLNLLNNSYKNSHAKYLRKRICRYSTAMKSYLWDL